MNVRKEIGRCTCALVIFGSLTSYQAAQAAGGISPFIGVGIGTTGLGIQGGIQVTPKLSVRLATGSLSLEDDREIDDVDYSADLDLEMPQLLVDYHPFGNGFFLSGGFSRNGSSLDAVGTLAESTQIGSIVVNPSDVGSLIAEVEYDNTSPYLGIGWRTGMGGQVASALSWQFELGLTSISDSSVTLTEEGSNFISQADLDEESRDIEDDLDDSFSAYLNLRIGIQYRF